MNNTDTWPTDSNGNVLECLHFENIKNVTFTSSSIGILDGQGEAWWGLLGYAEYLENRPRILSIGNSANILIENLYFKNSPYWTVWIYDVDGLEIRNSEVSNRRDDYDGHNFYNLWYNPFLIMKVEWKVHSIRMVSMSLEEMFGYMTVAYGIKMIVLQ